MEEQNTEEGLSAEALAEAGKGRGMGGKIIGMVVVIIVIALGVYALTRGSEEGNKITPEAASTENEEAAETPVVENNEVVSPVATEGTTTPETSAAASGQTVTVNFTDAGYAPAVVTIKKGDSVLFKNDSALETRPASALHPTHTVYPGSSIEKCGTSEQAGIFDACVGLKTGESFTFQFNNVGKWNYHDHLNVSKFGSITVTE